MANSLMRKRKSNLDPKRLPKGGELHGKCDTSRDLTQLMSHSLQLLLKIPIAGETSSVAPVQGSAGYQKDGVLRQGTFAYTAG